MVVQVMAGSVATVAWGEATCGACLVQALGGSGTLTPGDIDIWSAVGTVMVLEERGKCLKQTLHHVMMEICIRGHRYIDCCWHCYGTVSVR